MRWHVAVSAFLLLALVPTASAHDHDTLEIGACEGMLPVDAAGGVRELQVGTHGDPVEWAKCQARNGPIVLNQIQLTAPHCCPDVYPDQDAEWEISTYFSAIEAHAAAAREAIASALLALPPTPRAPEAPAVPQLEAPALPYSRAPDAPAVVVPDAPEAPGIPSMPLPEGPDAGVPTPPAATQPERVRDEALVFESDAGTLVVDSAQVASPRAARPPALAPVATLPPFAAPPVAGAPGALTVLSAAFAPSVSPSGFPSAFAAWTRALPFEFRLLLVSAALVLPYLILYRRIERRKLMDSEARAEVLRYVVANPGTTAAEVARAMGVYYNAARHHLDLLHEFGSLSRRALAGNIRYFENHGRYTPEEERALAATARDENVAFLRAVAAEPGLTQKEAGARLALAKSTVSKRVHILVEAGLLAREGGALRLTPQGAGTLAAAAGFN